MGALREHDGDPREGMCRECEKRVAVGPCAACESMICGECGVFSRDPEGVKVICASCAGLIADVKARRTARSAGRAPLHKIVAVVVLVAFAIVVVRLLTGCSSGHGSATQGNAAATPSATTASETTTTAAPPPRLLREVEPVVDPGGADDAPVAARLFLFADSQLHYLLGKRTFAQSPFAERMAFEVAVRPAALDDGSDLLLQAFLDQRAHYYPEHVPVFLGDAADVSCTHELDAFTDVLAGAGLTTLLATTSNHDGFFAGNFTSKNDLDGKLRLTDMPRDWTRACAKPGSFDDYRLTKGRAVEAFRALLPEGPRWATSSAAIDKDQPRHYRDSWLYYLRPLGGGDDGAPPVWGVFLDTVDYRGFDLEEARGAGTVGAVSHQQLRFLDRAMFEAAGAARGRPVTFVVFGHHPFGDLEKKSRARVRRFFATHPEVVAYVAGHTHASIERWIDTDPTDGEVRRVPEIVVGSTTDAPQAARALAIRVAGDGSARGVSSRRLVLDLDSTCESVPALDPDTTGYTGYRILRDGTPELDIGFLDKLAFGLGLDDLGKKRAIQYLGALLMENELVRSWARLYANAPLEHDELERETLRTIARTRYAEANDVAELRPYFEGRAAAAAHHISAYNAWYDPAVADLLALAELAVHRFGTHAAVFESLRARRTSTPEAHRYFLCHAYRAAAAEARQPRRRGDILYIR